MPSPSQAFIALVGVLIDVIVTQSKPLKSVKALEITELKQAQSHALQLRARV